MKDNYTVLITAAGSGTRLGLGYNKMLFRLKNGNTILEECVSIFEKDVRCRQIIVTASLDDIDEYHRLLNENIEIVIGGDTRQDSIKNGLNQVHEDIVLIHDGARPWLQLECIDRLLKTLKSNKAALLMVDAKDTIKEVIDGKVISTLNRSNLKHAQTPQAFHTRLIKSCYRKGYEEGIVASDDAQLVELCSEECVIAVKGSYDNIKVTTLEDIKDR